MVGSRPMFGCARADKNRCLATLDPKPMPRSATSARYGVTRAMLRGWAPAGNGITSFGSPNPATGDSEPPDDTAEGSMEPTAQAQLAQAFAFALDAHGTQTRKGRDIPYASHLLQVAGLVLEHGGDAELAAAALLHDTLEDCERVDATQLRARFGPRVAAVVEACTDTLPGEPPASKSPWADRKRRYLAQIAAATPDTHLVVACDKLHNLRSLLADLDSEGAGTLERFSARPEQTRAYHEAVREVVAPSIPEPLRCALDEAIATLASWIPESRFDA